MLIGMGSRNVLVPVSTTATREIDVLGSFRYANTYPEAIDLLSNGSLGELVGKMVTHRFALSETSRAFELMREGKDENGGLVLKVVVGSGVPC